MEKDNFPIYWMASRLEVSRSGFYDWKKRREPEDKWADAKIVIERIWLDSDKRFGYRMVHASLPDEWKYLTRYRVRKLMKELGIQGCTPFARKRTTIADPNTESKPDLMHRDFTSPVPTYKLVGDITYLQTGQGWLYLSTVIDLNTRMVVGWALSERMTADIVESALEMARGRGYIARGAIFHSDKGAQYTSRLVAAWAQKHDVRLSCSRTGNCHDNAVAESFFATLKNEMYYRHSFATRAEAKVAVIEFIEGYYNRRRPHSSIDYQIPAEVMAAFFDRTARAFAQDEGLPLAA